jgi:hypothetical protein
MDGSLECLELWSIRKKEFYKINKRIDDIMTQRDYKRALCIILKAGGSEVKDIKDNNNNYTIQCSISVYNF